MSLPKSQMLQLEKHFHCLSSCIRRLLSWKEGKELGAWLSIKWCPAMLLCVCACGSLCVQLWQQLCLLGGEIYYFLFSNGFLKANNRIVWGGHILEKTEMTGFDFLVFYSCWLRESRPMLTWELFGIHMKIQPSLPHPLLLWNFDLGK